MAAVMALVLIYAAAIGHAIWFIRRHPTSPKAQFVLLLASLFTAGLVLECLPRGRSSRSF